MSRTITALFDSRSEAEEARTRLSQSNIDADRVRIVGQDESGSGTSGSSSGSGDQGFWASVKSAFMPEEDSYAYDEGLRRGGYLLCAEVDEREADEAIAILDQSGSVDFDRRQDEWRNDGWTGYSAGTSAGALGTTGQSTVGNESRMTTNTVDEERIPIVEEQLRVGKREVARGGARVRSYIRETPVHEQVNLREEHVSVERRPVGEPISAADLDRDALFQERNIEMTETAEEAVVGKEARVAEELVVRKTSEEHVENVDDTVRRTEVEVDEGLRGSEDRSAFGSFGNRDTSAGTGGSGFGSDRDGYADERRETEGTGYSPPIDKSGV